MRWTIGPRYIDRISTAERLTDIVVMGRTTIYSRIDIGLAEPRSSSPNIISRWVEGPSS